MKSVFPFLLFSIFGFISTSLYSASSFAMRGGALITVTILDDKINKGDTSDLEVKISNAEIIDLPSEITNNEVLMNLISRSTEYETINFKTSTNAIFHYNVTPQKSGSLRVLLPIQINGINYTTPLLNIKALNFSGKGPLTPEEKKEALKVKTARILKAEDDAFDQMNKASSDLSQVEPPNYSTPSEMQDAINDYHKRQSIAENKLEKARERYKLAKEAAAPYHDIQNRIDQEEESKKSELAAKQAEENQRYMVAKVKSYNDNIINNQAAEVSDPESGKDGGPSTMEVLKMYNGTGSDFVRLAQEDPNAAMLKMVNQSKIREIKRGKRLTSLVSLQIPSGTTIFPVRLVIVDPNGVSSNLDLYCYKDEFGEWASVEKN